MAVAKEMGGSGLGSTPEHLFAMGYASCINSALLSVAGQQKVDASKAKVSCEVDIGRGEAGSFALRAKLTVEIPGLDAVAAKDLVDGAHQVCPSLQYHEGQQPVELVVE